MMNSVRNTVVRTSEKWPLNCWAEKVKEYIMMNLRKTKCGSKGTRNNSGQCPVMSFMSQWTLYLHI
jgi:hypothetical protein